MDDIPITNTGVPSSVTQPTKTPKKSQNKNVPLWWIIVSLVIIFILSAGLIVAVFFNFNPQKTEEEPCPDCCVDSTISNNYLECAIENEEYARDAQAGNITGVFAVNFNMEKVQLITGPFVLISLNQSVSDTAMPVSPNPTSVLSATYLNNEINNTQKTVALTSLVFSTQSFAESALNIDVFGNQTIVKQSTQKDYLCISTSQTQIVEYDGTTYVLFNLKFLQKDSVGNIIDSTGAIQYDYTLPKVRFIENQMVLQTPVLIGGSNNFRLIALNSQDPAFNSIFLTDTVTSGAVFATNTFIPKTVGGVINPVYTLTQWTPYYVFQQSR